MGPMSSSDDVAFRTDPSIGAFSCYDNCHQPTGHSGQGCPGKRPCCRKGLIKRSMQHTVSIWIFLQQLNLQIVPLNPYPAGGRRRSNNNNPWISRILDVKKSTFWGREGGKVRSNFWKELTPPRLTNETGSQKSNMADAKQKVPISQLQTIFLGRVFQPWQRRQRQTPPDMRITKWRKLMRK